MKSAATPSDGAERVGEDVDRHRPEPDDEARLVEHEHGASVRHGEQQDPRPEQRQRREHEHGRDEHAHQRSGRAEPDVLGAARVVAGHPVAGARELQRDRAEEQHPDEDVDREQRAEERDRRSLDREAEQQDEPDERGEAVVAERAAEGAASAGRGGRAPESGQLGHGNQLTRGR